MSSTPLKLATLLFSGGLATLAVTRAGLAGCDIAARPPPRTITPSDEEFTTPQPHTPAPHVIAEELPDDYFGGAKSDGEVWREPWKPTIAITTAEAPADPPPRPGAWFHLYTLTRRLAEPPPQPALPPRYFGGAKSDPDLSARDVAPTLPANYFGGAKSDADVWGDITGDDIAEAYGLTGLKQLDTTKRGRR